MIPEINKRKTKISSCEQHVTCWTWKRLDLDRFCPKSSRPVTGSSMGCQILVISIKGIECKLNCWMFWAMDQEISSTGISQFADTTDWVLRKCNLNMLQVNELWGSINALRTKTHSILKCKWPAFNVWVSVGTYCSEFKVLANLTYSAFS